MYLAMYVPKLWKLTPAPIERHRERARDNGDRRSFLHASLKMSIIRVPI